MIGRGGEGRGERACQWRRSENRERGNDPLAGNGEKGGGGQEKIHGEVGAGYGITEGREEGGREGGRDIHLNFLSISFARREGPQIILERKWEGRGGEGRRGE